MQIEILRPKVDLEPIYLINLQNPHNPWTKEAIKEELNLWAKTSKVLKNSQDQVMGYVLVRNLVDYYEITSIAVDKSIYRQGFGKMLLKNIIDEAKKSKNIKGLLLEVSQLNLAAVKLYEAFGFKQTRIRKAYYKDGSNALEMSLEFT
ncbi:MAG: ribosomal protein S18-alanine N-acetyltransferase [Oligoflexia bacterium]|nr:ribosomal protein S18-alanine N-acetyltransferase [Oligoflexia bacterium]